MRYAKRVDRNHGEIRDALRADGYVVTDLSDVGNGVPDLCVQDASLRFPGLFLEIKDGKLPPSARDLTPSERIFHGLLRDRVKVVLSPIHAKEVCLEYFHKGIDKADISLENTHRPITQDT